MPWLGGLGGGAGVGDVRSDIMYARRSSLAGRSASRQSAGYRDKTRTDAHRGREDAGLFDVDRFVRQHQRIEQIDSQQTSNQPKRRASARATPHATAGGAVAEQ